MWNGWARGSRWLRELSREGVMGDGNLVMVVDDDRELRESVCELLAEGGYDALGMANGAAALSYIREQQPKPKVILLDLMMPEMNGWQFREAQLGDPAISSIPVVVMTAGRDLGGDRKS